MDDALEMMAAPGRDTSLSSGAQLQAARERAGWTAERLAAEMCLSVDRLRALERNDHAGLGGAVFARGYLRRAAILLGLPPGELIAACEAPGDRTAEAQHAVFASGLPQRRGLPAGTGPTMGVAAVIAMMAGTWWWMAPGPETSPNASHGIVASGPSLEFVAPAEPQARPQARPQAFSAEPKSDEPREAAPAPVLQAEEAAQVVQEAEPALPAPGTVELRFTFSEDCWLEVTDADDARVAYRLYRAGEVTRLRGKAPMTVFLGNADGVQLTVDGAAMAVRPASRRDGTARLTVGGGAG